MTETNPFAITSGRYLATLISLWLPRHGWKVALPLVAVAAAGFIFSDERLILVALMLLFIVIPMGMSFLYTYYMLTPESRRSILVKQVIINPGTTLTIHYVESPEEETIPKENGTTLHALPPDETIPWNMVRRVKYTSSECIYILSTKRLQFILVPYDTLPRGAVLS